MQIFTERRRAVSETLFGLEPQSLWRHFARITQIPHCSGREEALRAYVLECARGRGLGFRVDEAGNVIVTSPAHPSMEGAPGVILQAHIDMVCEKDSASAHDFTKDPLPLVRDGDWVAAAGTTLGADNGIGLAAILAVLEDTSLAHGPLEALFTVDEERGLVGAFGLEPGCLEGTYFFNLDSEEEGVLCIGCAGGADSVFTLPVSRKARGRAQPVEIRVAGLKGGHSGIDIHLGRANAIKVLARVLFRLGEQLGCDLAAVQGGSARNAIPREARAHLFLAPGDVAAARSLVNEFSEEIRYEFRHTDPGLDITIEPAECTERPLNRRSQRTVIDALMALPHGVRSMSADVPGLVETSTNLASVRTSDTYVEIAQMSRSSIDSALAEMQASLRAFSRLSGAHLEQPEGYPGWTPDPDSPFVARLRNIYSELFGTEPALKAVHAGLETAIIGKKMPGLKMVSIGPEIRDPHSPGERVNILSVQRFWRFLLEALKRLTE